MEQKTQNKNKVIIALIAVTLVVLLIGIWAFARYTTTVSGTGTAAVASWSFKANEQTETFTGINLATTMDPVNGKVAANHIAPGTKGSFDIDIDASGSEVAVEYTIDMSNFQNRPQNLKFYTDSERTAANEISLTSSKYTVSGYIAQAAAMTKKVTIYWEWAYQTGTGDEIATNDAQDTSDAGKDVTFDITVTGVQSDPRVAAPAGE